jgi:hypothetical protein
MPKARARAAAVLLALAFGASGCDLVSSLTPFGVGTKDYGAGVKNVNGNWAGNTASGGEVTFQVGSDTVSLLHFEHVEATCTLTFDAPTAVPIVNGSFIVEIALTQGKVVATGTFTTAGTCSGTYFFEALPAGGCPTAGTGTFVAEKTTL